MRLFDRLNISTEAIVYQANSTFGHELTEVYVKIFEQNLDFKKIKDLGLYKSLSDVVFKHTNIPTFFILDNGSFAVSIPTFNTNTIMIQNSLKEEYAKHSQTKKEIDFILKNQKTNTVNLKTGKVSGIFTKLTCGININIKLAMDWGLTPQEVAALTLHEVGHLFTLYELMYRQTSTNLILSNLQNTISKNDTEEIEYKFKLFADELGIPKEKALEIASIQNTTEKQTILLGYFDIAMHSNSGTPGYDFVSCEQAADQYCARYGYAKHFITALDKFDPYSQEGYVKSRQLSWFIAATQSVYFTFGMTLAVGLMPSVGLVIFTLASLLGAFNTYRFNNTDKVYDDIVVRYKRFREDLINVLKTQKDKETKKIILDNIDEIQKIIDSLHKTMSIPEKWYNFVYKLIRPQSVRKTDNLRTLQRELEELNANELFVQAAKFEQVIK